MAKQGTPKLTAKRVYAISDSLRKESGLAGVGSPLSGLNKKSTAADSAKAYKAGFARIEAAEKNKKESVRLKGIADKAMANANAKLKAGRDKPLPSSDSIIGSITNKISELFK